MKSLTSKTGKLFAKPLVIAGYVVIILGIIIMLSATLPSVLMGVSFLFLGGFFAFSHSGIQLLPKEKKVKHYTSILGIRKGQFRAYDDYPFITIVKKNKGPYGKEVQLFEIHLLSKSRKGKVLLSLSKDEKKAYQSLNQLSKEFKVEKIDTENAPLHRNGKTHKGY